MKAEVKFVAFTRSYKSNQKSGNWKHHLTQSDFGSFHFFRRPHDNASFNLLVTIHFSQSTRTLSTHILPNVRTRFVNKCYPSENKSNLKVCMLFSTSQKQTKFYFRKLHSLASYDFQSFKLSEIEHHPSDLAATSNLQYKLPSMI